ncbi:MAG TPA: Ku protein [Polyangiaceae bacterium]|jgi:DNA end-binding protein Ku|nr:Ku protein [Polyangiaceae bacterium]
MPARSIGSGTISFGLVSIPVKLYTAATPKGVHFNFLHGKCGSRMKQQYVCPIDNEVVERKDMVRGYEHTKDTYVRFTEEELKTLEAERTSQLELLEFVPTTSVDLVSIEKTYYLGPDKGGDRAYALLSESMERAGRMAVGKFAQRGKENLVLVRPYKKGLVLHEVFYADEVRDFGEVETGGAFEFKPIERDLADKLIEQLAQDTFEPSRFKDEYAARVLAAVDAKVAGNEVTFSEEAPKAQIIDLLEALKRSVAATTAARAADDAPESAPGGGPKKASLREDEAEAEKSVG